MNEECVPAFGHQARWDLWCGFKWGINEECVPALGPQAKCDLWCRDKWNMTGQCAQVSGYQYFFFFLGGALTKV